jgi:antitoxin ParD1/3/4
MPTRNVELTDELDNFVATKVESGQYRDANEVVRAALQNLAQNDQQDGTKLQALRAAILEGDASGLATGDVFARVLNSLGLHDNQA